MKKKLLKHWDNFIYRHAFHTIRRMSINSPGFSYLLELQIKGWNAQNPIPESLKLATETFHKEMNK